MYEDAELAATVVEADAVEAGLLNVFSISSNLSSWNQYRLLYEIYRPRLQEPATPFVISNTSGRSDFVSNEYDCASDAWLLAASQNAGFSIPCNRFTLQLLVVDKAIQPPTLSWWTSQM
jgi:hypothetical protein